MDAPTPDPDTIYLWASVGDPADPPGRLPGGTCPRCGALVADRPKHAAWHARIGTVLADAVHGLRAAAAISRPDASTARSLTELADRGQAALDEGDA